jgi:hypothetical protein
VRPVTRSFRLRVAAGALTLLSGAVMVSAGYVAHADSWATAGLLTVPGGIMISAARALARRADRAEGRARSARP